MSNLPPVVVLCGGRGSRMGNRTDTQPKCLLVVHGRPLLWYVLAHYRSQGFKHFVLPLGYQGNQIVTYLTDQPDFHDCNFDFIQTGEDTPVSLRLKKILATLKSHDTFVLANSDAICTFDMRACYENHSRGGKSVTLCTTPIISQFGLVLVEDGAVVGFERASRVDHFSLFDSPDKVRGFVNTGISFIQTEELRERIEDLCKTNEDTFEQDFFGPLAIDQKVAFAHMTGFWKCFDTEKDLRSADTLETRELISEAVKQFSI